MGRIETPGISGFSVAEFGMKCADACGAVVRLQIQHGDTKFETWARATPACRDGESCVVLVFMDTPPEQAKLLASWLEGLSAR